VAFWRFYGEKISKNGTSENGATGKKGLKKLKPLLYEREKLIA
jgi:hypothetical protein